ESLRRELGVPVPIPDDDRTVTQALMKAVLLRRPADALQAEPFDYEQLDEVRELDVRWTDLPAKANRNRTDLPQRRLKPEEVLPEWERTQLALGSKHDVRRFVPRARARFDAGLEILPRGARAPLGGLPEPIRERLAADGLEGTIRI